MYQLITRVNGNSYFFNTEFNNEILLNNGKPYKNIKNIVRPLKDHELKLIADQIKDNWPIKHNLFYRVSVAKNTDCGIYVLTTESRLGGGKTQQYLPGAELLNVLEIGEIVIPDFSYNPKIWSTKEREIIVNNASILIKDNNWRFELTDELKQTISSLMYPPYLLLMQIHNRNLLNKN
jgi:hypothetical protein